VTNRTFDLWIVDNTGTPQDVAASAANRINVHLVLRCSELKA
jgi:hypothetical protein